MQLPGVCSFATARRQAQRARINLANRLAHSFTISQPKFENNLDLRRLGLLGMQLVHAKARNKLNAQRLCDVPSLRLRYMKLHREYLREFGEVTIRCENQLVATNRDRTDQKIDIRSLNAAGSTPIVKFGG